MIKMSNICHCQIYTRNIQSDSLEFTRTPKNRIIIKREQTIETEIEQSRNALSLFEKIQRFLQQKFEKNRIFKIQKLRFLGRKPYVKK